MRQVKAKLIRRFQSLCTHDKGYKIMSATHRYKTVDGEKNLKHARCVDCDAHLMLKAR